MKSPVKSLSIYVCVCSCGNPPDRLAKGTLIFSRLAGEGERKNESLECAAAAFSATCCTEGRARASVPSGCCLKAGYRKRSVKL
jgi:hypothetical protein